MVHRSRYAHTQVSILRAESVGPCDRLRANGPLIRGRDSTTHAIRGKERHTVGCHCLGYSI